MSLRFYPRGELGKQVGSNPGADTARRRIKKTLSKGLRSHRRWRGFTTPARAAKKSDFAKAGFLYSLSVRATNPGLCPTPAVRRVVALPYDVRGLASS